MLVMEGPGWATGSKVICIPQDHGIILHFLINLCLINSLENLGCRFEVARIGFTVLVFYFLRFFPLSFFPEHFFITLGVEEKAGVCHLLGNSASDEFTVSFGQGRF